MGAMRFHAEHQVTMTQPQDGASIYERIGGAQGVRRLTTRFYELMDSLPDARECRAIHPPSLDGSEQKLFEYLSYWFGGPPLFIERHGAPMMRRRHFKAAIGAKEVEGWLVCFRRAFEQTVCDPGLYDEVMPKVEALAVHMRNQA